MNPQQNFTPDKQPRVNFRRFPTCRCTSGCILEGPCASCTSTTACRHWGSGPPARIPCHLNASPVAQAAGPDQWRRPQPGKPPRRDKGAGVTFQSVPSVPPPFQILPPSGDYAD